MAMQVKSNFSPLASSDVPGFEGLGFGFSAFGANDDIQKAAPASNQPVRANFALPTTTALPFIGPIPYLVNPFFFSSKSINSEEVLSSVINIRSPISLNFANSSSSVQPLRAPASSAPAPAHTLQNAKVIEVISHLGVKASTPNLTAAAQQVSDIVANFDGILSLAFPDAVKSTRTTIEKGRENYLVMQRNTIPIAQDLYNYAQASILYINNSLVTKKIPLTQALSILKVAAQKRADSANQVASDHIKYKDAFDKTVNDIKSLKATYDNAISVLNDALAQAEKEHRDYTITASVFGVLTLLIPFIALPIMIGTAIKAADLQSVINELTTQKNQTQTIIDYLVKVIAKLALISTDLKSIIKIWGDISDNIVYIISSGYDLMQLQVELDPKYQPYEFEISNVIGKWNEVKDSSKQYLDKVRAPTS